MPNPTASSILQQQQAHYQAFISGSSVTLSHNNPTGSVPNPTISIGCDPELFLKSRATGKIVSAHNILPGTKKEPFCVPGGAVQVDGVAAEFNTTPAFNKVEWVTNLNDVKTRLQEMAVGFDLNIIPSYEFDSEYFASLPSATRMLGCDPDYNGWTCAVNPPPDGANTTLRTASGHIHIGWTNVKDPFTNDHFEDCCALARQLDYYMGIYSLLWDSDNRRRELYGKAGCFRPKPYGMEYRTLSNVWLRYPNLWPWVWQSAHNATKSMLRGGERLFETHGNWAQAVINSGNSDALKDRDTKSIILKVHKATGQSWPEW